jgi:hypothetical protein
MALTLPAAFPVVDDTALITDPWAAFLRQTGTGGSSGPLFAVNTLAIVANSVAIDLTLGVILQLTINQATQITIQSPSGSGSMLFFYIVMDGTVRPSPLWGADWGNDVKGLVMHGTNKFAAFSACKMGDGKWHLMGQQIVGATP